MGSTEATPYSVPQQTQDLFLKEIGNNPLVPGLPVEFAEAVPHVSFTASDGQPKIPINWRFAESISALKGFEATMLNILRLKKYNTKFSDVTIDTDHASLFIMHPLLTSWIDEENNEDPPEPPDMTKLRTFVNRGFPSTNLHRTIANLHRNLATNIYRTKDDQYYHIHSSLNPDPTLTALGLPLEPPTTAPEDHDTVVQRYQQAVGQHTAVDLDKLMNDQFHQAGTIAMSREEFLASEQGRAIAHVGLYEIHTAPLQSPPSWWPENASHPSSPSRPLAGLRVVDLSRIIAAPTISYCLAEMGASVMRVTNPKLPDIHELHPSMNWGKWSSDIDLKTPAGRATLRGLILDADVVIDGFRPGVMAKLGFGREEIFALVKHRERGIVHVRENCYGWYGPWKHRSGWQQISDAVCGVSMEYGRGMGLKEPVTPVWPNSDFCTGVVGSAAVLHGLIKRGTEGGSYGVDVALNYYSQWLVRSVGTYPEDVWQDLWARHGKIAFRHHHSMATTIPAMLQNLLEHDGTRLFKPEFFETRESRVTKNKIRALKQASQMDGVDFYFNVGTRGNGVDAPRWPDDLTTEVIS